MRPRSHGFLVLTASLYIGAGATTGLLAQQWNAVSPPDDRSEHAMVFDATRSRVVMFGGRGDGLSLGDTWEHDGTQWLFRPGANGPSPRADHAMAFDRTRSVTVLFGGTAGTPQNDTWEYDGNTWTQITTANAPPVRTGHAMSFDPTRGVVVLFGGAAGPYLGDTWEYDGSTWTQNAVVPPNAPSARTRHAMAFDAARGVHVLFGGIGVAGFGGDTWEYDGATWTPSSALGPIRRYGAGIAYRSSNSTITLFGGVRSNGQYMDDLWAYDGTAWAQLATATSPSGRRSMAMAYDPGNDRIVAHGGLATGIHQGDTWTYDGTDWNELAVPAAPSDRMSVGLAYDALRARTVLFGGQRFTGQWNIIGETWEHDGTGWSQITTSNGPSPRAWYGMDYDAGRGRVVLYGGWGGNGAPPLRDTWEFDGQDWTQPGTANSPRSSLVYSMAYDRRRSRHVVFGGYEVVGANVAITDETWEFDGQDWTQVVTPTTPAARIGQALSFDARRGRVVMFGGGGGGAQRNDTWEFDGYDWVQVLTTNAPSPRFVPDAMVYDPARGRSLLVGGISSGSINTDTWEYDGNDWRRVQGVNPPSELFAFGVAFDVARGRALRFGGRTFPNAGTRAQTWEYTPPAEATWSGYGVGCDGGTGRPFLSASALAHLGSNLVLDVSNLPASPGLLYVANGLEFGQANGQPLPLDLGPFGLVGCRLWIAPDPALSTGQGYTGNTASVTIPIPNQPALAGLRLGTQVLALDPASPNGVGALSNAGIGTIQ